MNTLRLALRMLARDWRAGELTVLIAAMVLAVASIGTVGFFADRVKGALTRQANLLLGADVLISGDRPLPETFAAEAGRRGLVVDAGAQASTAWCSAREPTDAAAAPCSPTSRRWRRAIRCAARSRSSIRRSAERRAGTRHSAARRGVARRAARGAARRRGRRCARGRRGDAHGRRDHPAGARGRERAARARAAAAASTSTTFRPRTCCSRAIARRIACSSPISSARDALDPYLDVAAGRAEAGPADGERARPAARSAADARARGAVPRARRRWSR